MMLTDGIKPYRVLTLVCVLVLVVSVSLTPVQNLDSWKHLIFGKYTGTFFKFPHHSVFTFAPVEGFVPSDTYDWFGSVLLYELFELGEYYTLNIVKLLFILPILWLGWFLNERNIDVTFGLLACFLLFGTYKKVYVRAAGFALPFVALTLGLLIMSRRERSIIPLYCLIPLLTAWSNIHGSFLVGFFLIVVFFLGDIADQTWGPHELSLIEIVKLFSILLAILLSVLFVKPYPNYAPVERLVNVPDQFSIPELTVTQGRDTNSDETSIVHSLYDGVKTISHRLIVQHGKNISGENEFGLKYFRSLSGLISFVFVPLILVFVLLENRGALRISTIVPVIFAFWLGIGIVRAIPLIPLVVVPLMFDDLKFHEDSLVLNSLNERFKTIIQSLLMLVLVGSILIGLVIPGFRLPITPDEIGWGKTKKLSSSMTDYSLNRFPETRFYTSADIGGYVLWEWWPRKKVFLYNKISSYQKSFYSKLTSRKKTQRLLVSYDIKAALISRENYARGNNLFELLPGWRLIAVSEPHPNLFLYCRCEPIQ